MSTRIGILTGGGDCPGLNGVIRAVTLHARQTYGWEVVGIRNGYEGLYEEDYIDLNAHQVQHTLGRGGTMLGSSNRANPFAYPVKLPDGRVEIHDVSTRCLANLGKLELHGLVVVGGDGTMAFGKKFIERGATRIVGVPKTIDNDLEATDYTVGFQTAVEVAVDAIGRLHTTAESHERIMIVEVMGRYAGWIALTAGLAGGAHVVLIPEIDYDLDRVIEAFHRRHGRGVSYSLVVIAEGAKPKGGSHAVVTAGDATKQEKLGGAGQRLADAISARTEYEVRTTVLGHILRGGSPCAFDRELATRFGVKAVELIAEGKFGHVAAMENGHLVAKPIEKAIKKLKLVDPQGELVRTAKGVGIELGDRLDADDLKAKLAEVDAKMRAKMAELGFTPEEIDRQMDRSIPDDVKKAERDEVLARKFASELADPKSGLMDAIIAKAVGDLEKQPKILPPPPPLKKSKLPLVIGGVVAAAAIAGAVWYFAFRDTTSSCQKLVGPLAELEQLTGAQLEMRSGYESKYSCYQYVDRRGKAGGSVVNIETTSGNDLQYAIDSEKNRKFIATQTFETALGEATLFVAGESKDFSPEELLADAKSRVGQSRDPMGAALANLPPGQHVALVQANNKVIKLQLDRELFTVDKAKTFVIAVAQRAR